MSDQKLFISYIQGEWKIVRLVTRAVILGKTCFAGLGLLLGAWWTPTWEILTWSSTFCDSHVWVSVRAWVVKSFLVRVQINIMLKFYPTTRFYPYFRLFRGFIWVFLDHHISPLCGIVATFGCCHWFFIILSLCTNPLIVELNHSLKLTNSLLWIWTVVYFHLHNLKSWSYHGCSK